MKFIHLSDLHIGKTVNNFPMIPEQKNAFRQILEYVRTTGPQAVVIAGDVYDRAIPSVEAVQVFDDFITALAAENIAVLLISGNHDSPERLGFGSRLLASSNIHFYGAFDGTMAKVTLCDNVHFWLLPFIKPSLVKGFFQVEVETYDQAVSAAIAASDVDYTACNVLVSHQFYAKSGTNPIKSDSELNPVGGLDAVDASIIENFDYVALGHLHANQHVGDKHIRYCGSPIKYSFSEVNHKKSITLVEIEGKGNVTTTQLPITPLHDMRKLKGNISQLIEPQGNPEDYLHITLTDNQEIIDPMGKLRSVYPNIMELDFDNYRTTSQIETTPNKEAIKNPYELFQQFFLETQGSTMTEEQGKFICQLLEGDAE